MEVDYNTLEVTYVEIENNTLCVGWCCNIGFGEIIVYHVGDSVAVADEYMGREFVKAVMAKVFEDSQYKSDY